MSFRVDWDVPLASRTTLQIGGKASHHATVADERELNLALAHGRIHRLKTFVLGDGSNVLVADEGFDGLVIELGDAHTSFDKDGDTVILRAGAGARWDDLVDVAAREGWAGIECLSGIPGRAGAAPVQNIGAYGQEVSQTLVKVRAAERRTGESTALEASACGFGYRWSHFKGAWAGRYIITQIELHLRRDGQPTVTHPELRDMLEMRPGGPAPSLSEVRQATLALRARKSMRIDPSDPNHRSAGSFFTNPVVSAQVADQVRERADANPDMPMPVFDIDGGMIKLSAAWLVEQAGFPRGYSEGHVGLSTAHALAIINRGGARAVDVVCLASSIRQMVRHRFDITLHPEPVFVGFEAPADVILG